MTWPICWPSSLNVLKRGPVRVEPPLSQTRLREIPSRDCGQRSELRNPSGLQARVRPALPVHCLGEEVVHPKWPHLNYDLVTAAGVVVASQRNWALGFAVPLASLQFTAVIAFDPLFLRAETSTLPSTNPHSRAHRQQPHVAVDARAILSPRQPSQFSLDTAQTHQKPRRLHEQTSWSGRALAA